MTEIGPVNVIDRHLLEFENFDAGRLGFDIGVDLAELVRRRGGRFERLDMRDIADPCDTSPGEQIIIAGGAHGGAEAVLG